MESERQLSDALVSEFLEKEMIVLGAQMYNFSVSSQLKASTDKIAQPGQTLSYNPTIAMSVLRSKQTLELKAEGLPDTILYSEESVVVNVQIFNVSMTIRRAGETLR
ncbi:NAD(P)H-dependent oxidoreductase [Citrobacter portucalensis]|uniref:NAD(P)H-dependent oxidoreductase n=1 Tax=Citrobacter portucalensis TaxID=1639133 RepID=UPI003D6EA70A